MTCWASSCGKPVVLVAKPIDGRMPKRVLAAPRACKVRASVVNSSESSSDFVKRMEQAWLISQQPGPVACSSCNSNGHVDCKWCGGTGFFIVGDKMLCQVPSRNSSCLVLYVLGRGQYAAPIVKEQASVPSGWGSLLSLPSNTVFQLTCRRKKFCRRSNLWPCNVNQTHP